MSSNEQPLRPVATPENTPLPRRRKSRSRKNDERNALRNANRLFLAKLALIITAACLFPAIPWAAPPAPVPAPKSPRSAEQPAYNNTPAEPAEGTASLRRRSGR